jgi:hypothetical protein
MTKQEKTILSISTIVVFFLIFVSLYVSSNRQTQYAKKVDKEMEMMNKMRADSIQNVQDSLKLIEAYKDSIQIIKKYVSEPNSAGGVDLNIIWKNKTKRVIKYARFKVSAINDVNDEVYSTISIYPGTEWVKVTGPVKPNQVDGYGTYWSCVWYNHTIKRCKIETVRLEFMDGSEIEFPI